MIFPSRTIRAVFLVTFGFLLMRHEARSEYPSPASEKALTVANNTVDISFRGVTAFHEKELREAISEQIEAIRMSGLTSALADDAAFFLGLFYRNHGYSQADVKSKIAAGRLALIVSEGPPATVEEVTFTGNASLPSTQLRDFLLGATKERLSMLKHQLPYISADIETGVERVRGLYQSEGFMDSVVAQPEIKFSSDKTRVLINVTIREGIRYRFGKLIFNGDLVFYPQTEILEALRPFSEKPYTQTQVTNMQRKVIYYYRSRGYFDVKVAVEGDPASARDGIVPVVFTVESGNVYRFGSVKVTGLDQLQSGFLPARFRKLRGKFYDPARLEEVYRDMMRTGLFRSLKITSKPLPDNTVELDMEVEEAKPKEIGFSGGYGTFEGPILGLQLGDRDLLGTGRPILATFEFSSRLLKGELSYTDPWFLETPNKLTLRLYALNRDWDGYSKFETGLRAELSRKLTSKLEGTIFLQTRKLSITDNGLDPAELGRTNYMVSSIGTAFTLDLRSQEKGEGKHPPTPANPGEGLVVKLSGEVATKVLGSSLDYLRGTISTTYYIPLKNTMLAFGARGGILYSTNGDLPIDERFFNGGSQSVRSFAERRLGPSDSSSFPVGGETFTVFNVEYTFPIFGDLEGALFTDAGSVGRRVSDGIGELRYGVGPGVRYKLPIGPLRLDYGYNPTRKSGEAIGAFHFSFGFAF